MTDDRTLRIATLKHEIATLQQALAILEGRPAETWPKPVRLYYTCPPAWLEEIADNLHLSPTANQLFRASAHECGHEILVAEDGHITTLTCSGQRLREHHGSICLRVEESDL